MHPLELAKIGTHTQQHVMKVMMQLLQHNANLGKVYNSHFSLGTSFWIGPALSPKSPHCSHLRFRRFQLLVHGSGSSMGPMLPCVHILTPLKPPAQSSSHLSGCSGGYRSDEASAAQLSKSRSRASVALLGVRTCNHNAMI